MSYVYDPNIASRVLSNLLPEWRNDPTYRAIAESIAEEMQEVEDTISDMITQRAISAAEGVNLDRYGVLVDLERLARSDDEYRIAILTKIRANKEGYLASVVGDIAAVFFDSQTYGARYYTLSRAAYSVSVTPDSVLSTEHLAQGVQILRDMSPAGVGLAEVIETTDNPYTLDLPGFGIDQGELSKGIL